MDALEAALEEAERVYEEASAAILAGRLARRGFDAEAIRVVLEALEVPVYARRRVLEALGGEA